MRAFLVASSVVGAGDIWPQPACTFWNRQYQRPCVVDVQRLPPFR
jgi:hypothetical protein